MKTRKILARMFQEKALYDEGAWGSSTMAGMEHAIEVVARSRSNQRAEAIDDALDSYFAPDFFGVCAVDGTNGRREFDGFCDLLDCVGLLPQGVRQ